MSLVTIVLAKPLPFVVVFESVLKGLFVLPDVFHCLVRYDSSSGKILGIPCTSRKVVHITTMPILSPDALPFLILHLYLTRQKFTVQSKLRELEFDTLTCHAVKEKILGSEAIEKRIDPVRLA